MNGFGLKMAFPVLWLVAALGSAAWADEIDTTFQQQLIFQSGGPESHLDYPYIFQRGTWVQFDEDEEGNLLICAAALGIGDCLFTHQPPDTIWAVELVPHCQSDTIALSFEVLRSSAPSIFVYFISGVITLDKYEAEAWVVDDPNCSFVFETNIETGD